MARQTTIDYRKRTGKGISVCPVCGKNGIRHMVAEEDLDLNDIAGTVMHTERIHTMKGGFKIGSAVIICKIPKGGKS